jgi:branched-chain amino acid transport system substrate-binding protein
MAMAVLAPVARVVVIARLVPVAVALLAAVALTACGGDSATVAKTTTTKGKHHVQRVQPVAYIYAGLPLNGPMAREGRAIRSGIYLAKKNLRTRPGDLRIKFVVLNDSGRKSGDANLSLTVTNAGTVATDSRAVYYIGDVGSATTTVSLPILDAAGIAQVTPADPYIPPPGPQSGSGAQTPKLLRLLPPYTVQAAADMLFFTQVPPKDQACKSVVAIAQDDAESIALVNLMYTHAKADLMQMPKPTQLTGKANVLTSPQMTTLDHQSPRPCGFVIAGSEAKPAVKLTKLLHSLFPLAFIVGTSGLCNSKWAKASTHGASAVVDGLLWCTSPLLPLDKYDGGTDFVELYKGAHHGANPSPYAFYGYEAADLGIDVIHDLGADGNNRVAVRTNLSGSQTDVSVFGQFGLLLDGKSSTLTAYGVYSVSPTTGEASYFTTLKPPVP